MKRVNGYRWYTQNCNNSKPCDLGPKMWFASLRGFSGVWPHRRWLRVVLVAPHQVCTLEPVRATCKDLKWDLYEEFTRLAETRLAQNTFKYTNIYSGTLKCLNVQDTLITLKCLVSASLINSSYEGSPKPSTALHLRPLHSKGSKLVGPSLRMQVWTASLRGCRRLLRSAPNPLQSEWVGSEVQGPAAGLCAVCKDSGPRAHAWPCETRSPAGTSGPEKQPCR